MSGSAGSVRFWCALLVSHLLLINTGLADNQPGSRFQFRFDDGHNDQAFYSYEAASPGIRTFAVVDELLAEPLLTLNDWLDIVPGFYVSPAYGIDWPSALGIRGSVKMMIDGASITHPRDYSFASGLSLFWEEFDSVETTSGPAGVLWGQFSLLGVINMISRPPSKTPIRRLRWMEGVPGLHRGTFLGAMPLGSGYLQLFVGAGTSQTPAGEYRQLMQSVPPYDLVPTLAETLNLDPTYVGPNFHAVFSLRYQNGPWQFYIRAPRSRHLYPVNSLGVQVEDGDTNSRSSSEVLSSIRYSKSFLKEHLATVARLSWRWVAERENAVWSLASSPSLSMARSRLFLSVSQISALTEARVKFQGDTIRSETLIGTENIGELVHRATYQDVDPNLSTPSRIVFTDSERAATGGNVVFSSFYLLQDLRLFERLSLSGGIRTDLGANLYGDSTLREGHVALRLWAKTILKLSYTEGMRPPTLLDRRGLTPVQSRFLLPETSSSTQLELSNVWKNKGIFRSFEARANIAQTLTQNNVLLEPSQFNPRIASSVNADGFVARTIEGMIRAELKPWDSQYLLSVYWNEVNDVRILSTDPRTRTQAQLENPRCRLRRCVNTGPEWAIHNRITVRPNENWMVRVGSRLQCGGLRAIPVLSSENRILAPYDSQRTVRKVPCLAPADVAVGWDIQPGRLSIRLAVDNILDQRLPPQIDSNPLLNFNEGFGFQSRGRLAYLSLHWQQ